MFFVYHHEAVGRLVRSTPWLLPSRKPLRRALQGMGVSIMRRTMTVTACSPIDTDVMC
jgi:hypothetical protein